MTAPARPAPRPRREVSVHRLLEGLKPGVTLDLAASRALRGPLPDASAAALLEAVDASGLLGRGGAGFPTGRKWRTVAAGSKTPVVVCNAAEGEPGSGKDRVLISSDPHLVLDGVAVACRATGADTAYVVVHRGSPLVAVLRRAVAERRDSVPAQVVELPHRYVASEESAVVSFLNGGDARPIATPPRPFEKGVKGRPTLINNAETLAHAALVARRGPAWFREVGDASEPGTLLLSIAGQVVEVASGTTVADALNVAGVSSTSLQAVLVGGYFGTWLPWTRVADVPLTHAALRKVGGALGAGILLPLADDRCGLVETARVLEYLAGESAGQCGPCLNGLPSIAGALSRLANGPWDERFGPALDRWLTVVPGRGACRHPDGAVRLALTALSTFAADVEVHRHQGPCSLVHAAPVLPLPSSRFAGWR